ncbi:dephospho-CoA kinase [Streptococcus porcinus]|uniref:Dephospho-CoA kinase n=2 Tax=Streptococcus porcinus TaxID=1340 RepID=A0A4V6LYP4_STRPO|nr:dephospho-CoA kinase [Streptococcus porcinus]SQG44789.1 dephospho-CoA kinase [Streptococcus porcinus]VTT45099.1 dephospho-CoA kinase [Streptococcus porcinus]VTT46617.1 dephospho-CoA kinase [Streptococcus porcinus]
MTIIGITGGIASGKSTLVEQVRLAGYKVLDADQIVHTLQEKGGRLYNALVKTFGPEILTEDERLDRPKLSEMIFSSQENRELSANIQNQIIHEELEKAKDTLVVSEDVFFMDIPLLIELGYQNWFDTIWLVYVPKDIQIARLMARNHYSRDEALQRLASQMPLEEKRAFADKIFDNSGSVEDLKRQVSDALRKLI